MKIVPKGMLGGSRHKKQRKTKGRSKSTARRSAVNKSAYKKKVRRTVKQRGGGMHKKH